MNTENTNESHNRLEEEALANYDEKQRNDLEALGSATATEYTGKEAEVKIQSLYDPQVKDKDANYDEYSFIAAVSDPQRYLMIMADNMDSLGGAIKNDLLFAVNFKRYSYAPPKRGDVIDIDIRSSFINAPVIITEVSENHFTVETITLNGKKHPLYGTRTWGYEDLGNGEYRFYTRAISIERDMKYAPLESSIEPGIERETWKNWRDSLKDYIKKEGGYIVPDSDITHQSRQPSLSKVIIKAEEIAEKIKKKAGCLNKTIKAEEIRNKAKYLNETIKSLR